MSLVIFTALVGLVIAPVHVHLILAFTSILCIAVGAGASGALNMAYEGDIDALMSRTANRPIPRGRITQGEALAFGVLVFLYGVFEAFSKKRIAGANPWGEGATTLEWQLPSPPPFHQWEQLPKIR